MISLVRAVNNVSAYAGGSYVYVELVNSSDGALSDYYFSVSVVC